MTNNIQYSEARKLRTIFLSDMHLGSKFCKASRILSYLREFKAETVYLIGDIIDDWSLKRRWYWPKEHNEVLLALIKMAGEGVRVIYTPGNHDEYLRTYCGSVFKGIEIVERAIHTTADGKRFLVLHGDQFDRVTSATPVLSRMGDIAYDILLNVNDFNSQMRKLLGLSEWSVSAFLKFKVKQVINFISKYEELLVAEAKNFGVDGIICGHIHHAVIENIKGIIYMNTGDWVESCTSITESYDGEMNLTSHFKEISTVPYKMTFPCAIPESLECLLNPKLNVSVKLNAPVTPQ